MGLIANFIRFPAVQTFRKSVTVTESLKVGTFLRHSVVIVSYSFGHGVE